jgi:uncharacterized caspase-like protein
VVVLSRLGLGLVLWLLTVTAALAEKRVALILAVDDYKFVRPLENPANDAREMEDLLEKLDFEVVVETNRNLSRMQRALADFRTDAAGADVALFFFAGHGVALDGVNYLLPTDADASSAERLAATSLSLAEAQEVLQAVAPVSIMLLDACRDDPFAGGGTEGRGAATLGDDPPTAPKASPGLGRMGRADGALFAFAAAPNEVAMDGDGENSPFTAALVRHFATAGVELRTALTLVQQDVYDRSRGQQLPYIESGLPELVFITGQGVLPERDQLLMAMAELTPDLRAEVEALAAERNMPLAPLYAALLSADLAGQGPEERARLLLEAALSYENFQTELQRFQSDDPRVADLRRQADEQLTLGAFDTARALLTEAAEIDSAARTTIKATYLSRTVSEAATHMLNANAARTDLRYDLAIADLSKAVALYGEIEGEALDRETQFSYIGALTQLGDLQLVAGNTQAALDAYFRRSAYAQKQVEANPTDVEWVRELIWSLNSVGGVLQQQGYSKEAETAYASALEFSQWLADQMPENTDLMRDRQSALNRLGVVRFNRNDFAGALQAHREALGIADWLLALDPTSFLYRRDIAYTQERLGDVLISMGDKEGARVAFDISLQVTDTLAAEYPDDQEVRRDLSVSYERIGDMIVGDGDLDAGLQMYGKALEIREALAALDPDNMPRRRDLAVTFERIADIQGRLGDQDSAILSHQAAADIRQKLVALDPTNMIWQRDLSVSYERLGDIYYNQNDFVTALEMHERGRAIREGAVSLDPLNLPGQRDLGVALEKIGDVKLAMGDTEGAQTIQQTALELRRSLVAADPNVLLYKRDTAVSWSKLGELHRSASNPDAAEAALAEVVTLRAELAGAQPDDIVALRDLSIAQNQHAAILLDLRRNSEALTVAQASLETANRILQIAPDVGDHIHDMLVTLNRLGDAQAALGDNMAAVQTFGLMVERGKDLQKIDAFNESWADGLAFALERKGREQSALGDYAGALVSTLDVVKLREWLVERDGSNIGWYRNLALAYERVATVLYNQQDLQTALGHQDVSLAMMRKLLETYPDDAWYKLDVVHALDVRGGLLQDGTAEFQEALTMLEGMRADGTLPQGYEDWIPIFRNLLGLPKEF